MARDVTHEVCGSHWHGYTCGIIGPHKNHQAVKNGKTIAMWSDDVATEREGEDGKPEQD